MILRHRKKKTTVRIGDLIALLGRRGEDGKICFIRRGERLQLDDHDAFPVKKTFGTLAHFHMFCRILAATHGLVVIPFSGDERPPEAQFCYQLMEK